MILPYILACFSCWAQNISDLQNNVKNIPLPHSLVGITSGDSILHIASITNIGCEYGFLPEAIAP